MKKVQKQIKRLLCVTLMLSMIAGSLSGCGLEKKATEVIVQDTVTEVNEITLSSKGQDALLLLAGEKPELQLDTTVGKVVDIAVTPEDKTLEPYKYYTVTVTLAAKDNESFTKSAVAALDGVELKVKEWSKDKLVVEYTALALPETVTTEAMSKVSSYGNAKEEKTIGTAKVQALLDYELTMFSEDGKNTYIIESGFAPLCMIPSFVANGSLEQIKDGTNVQIISEHGEKDFPGAKGQWYKVAVDGKVGYIPASFAKDVKIKENNAIAQQTPEPSPVVEVAENPVQTKPAVKPVVNQNKPPIVAENTNNSESSPKDDDSSDNDDDSDNDSDDGIQNITYNKIAFALGGGISSEDAFLPEEIMVQSNSVISLNQLATPSVPGYLFDAWFYDSALTRQVQDGDIISNNMTLYAKLQEFTGEEVAVGKNNYVSSIEVDASEFTVTVLKPAKLRSTEAIGEMVKLHDISNPETTLGVQVLAVENTTIGNIEYEKYQISSDELVDGATYQLELLNGNCVFYYEEQLQPAVVRFYNFTTKMSEIENLALNNNLIYLKKEEVSYTEGSDYLSGLFNATVEGDNTQLNTVEGSGSFIYEGDQPIEVGTTIVIYDGAEVPELGENGLASAENYDGNAAYLTVSKIEGNTFYYGVAEAEDVLFTPDVLPVNIVDDEDENENTITIDTEKLCYSGSDYEEMGLNQDTTVDVGDYLAFYSGSLETAVELNFGKITAISVSDENTILTYEVVDENEVLEAMTVYSKEEMEIELDEDTVAAIEEEMEKDAIDSGFAMEAANYLATVALATEELQTLNEEMGLQGFTYTLENGSAATQSDLQLMAGNNVKVDGLKVKANVSRKLENLGGGTSNKKNGVRAQLEVSFNITVGSGNNKLVLKVSAVFEQEVLLNLNIKGKTVWGKKWIFPYIKDYKITTNLDVGTYTGIAITATVVTDERPEYDWSTVDKSLSEQIRELMRQQDKFFNQDINSIGGGLAGKYADMMKNNSEWVELVEVKIFSTEAKILAGIIVVGVQADFVVSAKVNIMLGMTFEYGVAKRYTFTLNVFSKTSSSNAVDLEKSHYNFDMYVMGTIGIRAGVRLTVYAGLFSKKVAAIGVTAEAGAYLQLWGYFFYSNSWEAESGKSSSVSGAMLMELGAYLEIRFLATAFGGTFEYNPILYDKYWPLWNMGSVENVYDFNYKTTVGVADDKDIHMGAETSVALPLNRMNMSYMNLRDGKINNRTYTYSDFTITTTGNFTYENGVIKVNPQDGSAEEKGTIKLTWNGAELSFTSQPLSCEMDLTWSDPTRKHNVSYELHGGNAIENGNVLPDGIPNVEVTTGGVLTAPTVEVIRDYYTFDGWYTDAACTIPWNFATDKVTANLVLHAKWKPITYDITYELFGGSNHSSNPTTYTVETAVVLQEPVRVGYQFAGWNTAADGTGNNVTEIPVGSYGTKSFYAQWIALEQTYEIHHMLEVFDGSGYEDVETVTATAKTGEVVTVGAEQSKAYTGFTYDATITTENSGTIPGEGTLVLKLYYSRNSYDVTFVSGEDTESVVVATKYQGKVEEPEAPSREGYDFTGWFVITESSRLWDFENDVVTEATELRAGWDAKEYNVTFDMQSGNGGDNNVMARYDSQMANIATPARAGYQFMGYYDADGIQYYNADGSSARVWDKAELPEGAEYFILYAKWQANSYEIVFNANGGSGTMDNQSFSYDEEKALTENSFTRTGYTFAGWAIADNAEEADYIDAEVVRNLTATEGASVTLYALWKPVTYSIIFDGNDATDGSMDKQDMIYDLATALHANGYTKTGYHFAGWSTEKNGTVVYQEGAFVSNLADIQEQSVTLYAVWEANTYSVAFYSNGGSGIMDNQSFIYDEAAKELSINSYSRTGYSFVGWATESTATSVVYTDGQAVQNLTSEHQELLTLYAVWKANNYEVVFDANGGSGTMDNQSFIYGEEKTLTENSFTRTGYTFIGWATERTAATVAYTDGQTVQNLISEHQGVLTLYAVWKVNQYTVSFDSNKGNGSSTPTIADAITVTYNSTYGSLPIVTRDGYTFNGWYTDASAGTQVQADDSVLLTENQTLYAQWTANSYDVIYDAAKGSFTDGTTNQSITQLYDSNYSLPETNPTRDGYTFLGWFTGETEGTEVTTATKMVKAQEHTLYAVWQANSYTVVFDANGGSGTMDNQSFIYGEEKTLTENSFTRTGYTFVGWATESMVTNTTYTDAQKVQNLTSEHQGIVTLYAVWQANRYTVSFDSNKGNGSSTPTTADEITVTYHSIYGSLPTVTRDGYTFNGWYTDASAGTQVQAGDSVLLTENQTLYAQWTANSYDVTYNAGEGSFTDGTTSQSIAQLYDSNYSLPETNPTRDGYTFLGWFTGETEETEVTTTTKMVKAQEHTLYAQWQAEVPNEISVSVGGVTLNYSGIAVYAKTDSTGAVTAEGNENDYNIKLENGVLTLKDAVITYAPDSYYHNGALSATGNLTITLAEGTKNTITNTSANSGISAWNCGVYVDGNLTINGSGSLTAIGGNGQSSHGVSVDGGDLIIDGAVVDAIGGDAAGSSGIYTGSDVVIRNGATVSAKGGTASGGASVGIESCGTITITNSSGSAQGDTKAMTVAPTITEATSSGTNTDTTMTWSKSTEE